jgi:hypothetical protein
VVQHGQQRPGFGQDDGRVVAVFARIIALYVAFRAAFGAAEVGVQAAAQGVELGVQVEALHELHLRAAFALGLGADELRLAAEAREPGPVQGGVAVAGAAQGQVRVRVPEDFQPALVPEPLEEQPLRAREGVEPRRRHGGPGQGPGHAVQVPGEEAVVEPRGGPAPVLQAAHVGRGDVSQAGQQRGGPGRHLAAQVREVARGHALAQQVFHERGEPHAPGQEVVRRERQAGEGAVLQGHGADHVEQQPGLVEPPGLHGGVVGEAPTQALHKGVEGGHARQQARPGHLGRGPARG